MKTRLTTALFVCLPGILTASGCQCHNLACAPGDGRTACYTCPRWGLFRSRTPAVAAPPPVVANPMPQPPAAIGSPVPQPTLQAPVPATPGPTDYRSFGSPPVDQTWHPAPGSQATAPNPATTSPEPPPASLRLLPPEPAPPTSTESPPPGVTEERRPEPAVSEGRSPTLPVGIPQFAIVRDQVAAGLKPSLDGGLDWLQLNGYRTVLHVRSPGEEDSADRREVEKRGLKYLSIDVSPQTLSRALVEQFSRIVNDKANYPLFVYDKDGMKAGTLWYLTFRLIDHESDDAARARARRLGLKENPEGNHRALWLAIQKVLSPSGQ